MAIRNLVTMLVIAVAGLTASAAVAQDYAPSARAVSPFPGIGYNYYYPAGAAAPLPARLYLCPLPIPLQMGYTRITYPPLAPHHLLYQHERTYITPHPGGAVTITTISWE